jgi:hypothetical protein
MTRVCARGHSHRGPGGVEAVVIGTKAETAHSTTVEGFEMRISHVWTHRSVGASSVSSSATEYGRERGAR